MASIMPKYNKEGSIIAYRFRVCLGRETSGKQKTVSKTVPVPEGLSPKKAEREMQRQADEWERNLGAGFTPTKKTGYRSFVDDVWFPVHVRNGEHKPSTIDYYRRMSKRLVEHFGQQDINTIKALDIQRFINQLRTNEKQRGNQPLSDTTVKHYINLLRIQFGFAEKHDLVERNPMRKIDAPKRVHKPVDFLTQEQAKVFLKALDTEPLRWRCMMTLLMSCGLRRGEAVALQWRDISFKDATLSIERAVTYTKEAGITIGKPKSANSMRILPLTSGMLALLRQWQIAQRRECLQISLLPRAFVFGLEIDPYSTMFPTTPTRWMSKFIKRHNLPDVSPHDLRHTCGTLLLMSGATIKDTQDFLGHEDAKTTLAFYAASSPESLRKAAEGLNRILSV